MKRARREGSNNFTFNEFASVGSAHQSKLCNNSVQVFLVIDLMCLASSKFRYVGMCKTSEVS